MVVLGEVGRNFGAGMTGGMAFVWDPGMGLKARLAETAPPARRPSDSELVTLQALLLEHRANTGSPVAQGLLDGELGNLDEFWVILPGEPTSEVEVSQPARQGIAD